MKNNASQPEWQAVIDIGSNSVRLVIYDVAGRALLPHYNEKVMARLGASLSKRGHLSREGQKIAMKAIRRYHAILKGLKVKNVRAVATAAVRRASDGSEFVAQIEEETGIRVDIIDGAEEARLSALGVSGSVFQAEGVVGDLGGSSLEFARLSSGKIKSAETHMLGPLAINLNGLGREDIQSMVRKALAKSRVLQKGGERFYMVGGAWRALAKLHMSVSGYPLRQLHAYVLNARAIEEIATIAQSPDALSRQQLETVSQKRAASLPYASILLSEIFKSGKFHDAMVSSHGVREGVVLDQVRKGADSDPLYDGVALSVRMHDKRREFGEALFGWIGPAISSHPDLFGDIGVDQRLIRAACLFADSGARFHPDTRAQLAHEQTLMAPYTGVTHVERAFIALAVGHRYSRGFRAQTKIMAMLNERQILLAKQLGAVMRLGAVFSGRSAALLANSNIRRDKAQISLLVPHEHKAMVSSMVERRLETLAVLLELQPNIEIV